MIDKYFKTNKYLSAFIFKKFHTTEPISIPNNKLTIYPFLSEAIPIYVFYFGTIINSIPFTLKGIQV